MAAARPRNSSPAQAESRVEICELLPGLMEWEARQVIQKALGRIPESTIKQILQQTGNSLCSLTHLIDRLKERKEINTDCNLDDLLPLAEPSLLALTR